MESLSGNLRNLSMNEEQNQKEGQPQSMFHPSMASHTLQTFSAEETQQTLKSLRLQQEQIETQLKLMVIEENQLDSKSEQYKGQFAQFQQFLGHQQAQLELRLHQLSLQQKYEEQQRRGELLPGSCWM